MSDLQTTLPNAETETSATTAVPATPPQEQRNGRTVFYVLISVIVGFLLPLCACITFIGISTVSLVAAGSGSSAPTTTSTGTGDAVAIIDIVGPIISGEDSDIGAAAGAISGRVIADLESASADNSVKAIVLRVDSPGGTVTGSAQIYEALLEIDKPIVVSMGGIAASGGYYVSAPADHIIARPDTFTGSLGVIITLFNADELLDELGVEVNAIVSGPNKDLGSTWEPLTPEQEAIMQSLVDESYEDFVRVIVNGRPLTDAEVRELADGRIYSGRQAADNGLVDALGNFDDAITKAAELGGISGTPRIIEYERLPTFSQLLGGLSSRLTETEADRIQATISELTTPTLQYRYYGPGTE